MCSLGLMATGPGGIETSVYNPRSLHFQHCNSLSAWRCLHHYSVMIGTVTGATLCFNPFRYMLASLILFSLCCACFKYWKFYCTFLVELCMLLMSPSKSWVPKVQGRTSECVHVQLHKKLLSTVHIPFWYFIIYLSFGNWLWEHTCFSGDF